MFKLTCSLSITIYDTLLYLTSIMNVLLHYCIKTLEEIRRGEGAIRKLSRCQ